MLRQLSNRFPAYPSQFWLLFWGLLLSASGASMIWPFLMIYVSKRLDLPLAQVATLMTINAVSSVAASFVAGFIADRLGRKGVMLVSLFAESGLFIALAWAETYPQFAVLMALRGFANPLYRVGADAMLADLIPQEQRAEAYSLIRMINNAGIAIGPIAGGMLAAQSYNLAFYVAAAGMALYGLLLTFFARETLARDWKRHEEKIPSSLRWAYVQVLTDLRFMPFISLVMFGWVTATLMWIIMPKYAYDNFGITENVYGPIPATNALMVVFLQMFVTMFTRRHRPLSMIALGMFLYALANGLVALSSGFWGFWLAMVVMTLGELVIVPTASTHTANIAPADMRGRYMSIFGLTWSFGQGVGPVLGGLLNDHFGPRAIWVGGMLIGLVSAFGLFLLSRRADAPHTASRRDALPSFTANPREPEGR
ncbi:MAG: MFS transporter [Anaerolineales bacterium]|nr:MFS transporter [Anaerolineales bacterium]